MRIIKIFHPLAILCFCHTVVFPCLASPTWAEEALNLLEDGNRAFVHGKYHDAEILLDKALNMDPDNYKAIRISADVKIKLEKYSEAERLLDRLLKMPTSTGRNILVYIEGNPEPHEAELVDETVMMLPVDTGGTENSKVEKFLKKPANDPIPHYRLFFKKSKKMKLLPKDKTRIKYSGIPAATRKLVMDLKTQVQKKIISTGQHKPEEEMVSIKGGCFQMGSKVGNPDELPVHEVCISSFKLGKYEVRQKSYQAAMGVNPSENVGADHPVDSVSWLDARDYCKKLGLRLPSEAEWEYATRGATQTEFYWGNRVTGKEANFCDKTCELNIREPRVTDGFKHTAPVGSFPPNPFGLYDMSGNVSEWVQDWLDVEKNYYLVSPKKDPPGPRPELDTCAGVCAGAASITHKISRGGSWNQRVSEMRSANRRYSHFQLQAVGNGFRCAGD